MRLLATSIRGGKKGLVESFERLTSLGRKVAEARTTDATPPGGKELDDEL